MSTTTQETHLPQLLAASLIAIPVISFGLFALAGPLGHFAIYLLLTWTIAAVATAITFTVDRQFMDQFSTSEHLAILAGNGMVAVLVAYSAFVALG